MNKIEKDLRFLKIYAVLLSLAFALLFGLFIRFVCATKYSEIDVERINIVEADGQLRMVISNQARQHPGSMDGVVYSDRTGTRPPGMMFFNERGDEQGGLVFDGNRGKGQGGSFTFDKFRGDQTIQLIHEEDENGNYFSGLKMNDQNLPLADLLERQKEISRLPTKMEQESAFRRLRDQGLLMTERLRIGRDTDKSSVVKMKDAKGKLRIELKVEPNGNPKLNFLNEDGRIIYSLPPSSNIKTSSKSL